MFATCVMFFICQVNVLCFVVKCVLYCCKTEILVLQRGRTAPLVTERSELPAPDYGTVFRHS